jgi:hypothetical protein
MAKVFDATLKQLVDRFGADWTEYLCRRLGFPEGTRATPLDADLSIATSQADKLFQLCEPATGILHLELESTWAGEIEGDCYCTMFLPNIGMAAQSIRL